MQTVTTAMAEQQAQWQIKATVAEVTASIGIVANAQGSKVVIKADDIIMTDQTGGAYAKQPFVVQGGQVYINSGVIRDLDSVNIYAAQIANARTNPTFTINGATGAISGASLTSAAINGGTIRGTDFRSTNWISNRVGFRFWDTGAEINSGVTINAATVRGELTAASVRANKIVGDIVSGKPQYHGAQAYDLPAPGGWVTIASASCKASSSGKSRSIACLGISGQYGNQSRDASVRKWKWRIVVNGSQVAYGEITSIRSGSGPNYQFAGSVNASGGANIGTGTGYIQVQVGALGNATRFTRNAQQVVWMLLPTGSEFN